MAETSSEWAKAVSGNFATAADWTAGVPDSTTADADLEVGGKAYTVTSSATETVDFLELASNATLAITGASLFTIDSSISSFSHANNLGVIDIEAGSTMVIGAAGSPGGDGSEIFNDGAVNISGSATTSTLEIAAPFFDFNGDGDVTLSGNAAIVGATTNASTLDNEDNTIEGSGTIGNGSGATGGNGLTVQNSARGAIDANSATALILNTGSNAILNAGLIETTGAGGLVIDSFLRQDGQLVADGTGALKINGAEVDGGGTVVIDKKASIVLADGILDSGGTITIAAGGTLTNTAGDTQAVASNNEFAGDVLTDGDIENSGTIKIANDSTLNFNGSVYNSGAGKVTLGGRTGPTELEIFGDGASFWAGSLVLSNSLDNSIVSNGAGVQLTNASTISGAGTIGDGWLRLFNSTLGVVDADDSDGLTILGDGFALSASSESANYNAGTVETTGAGGLTITGVFQNGGTLSANGVGALTLDGASVNGGGGIVQTVGSGSIILEDNSLIDNQTDVTIAAGGTLSTTAGDTGDVVETTVFNRGTINVADDSTLVISGHWQNSGLVTLNGTGDPTSIKIASGQTLELLGGGTVTLSGSGDTIISGGPGTQLNNKNNTIEGSGSIGDANMTVDNNTGATINATGALSVDAIAYNSGTGVSSLFNGGVMEAASNGTLTIQTAMLNFGQLIANSGGSIDAQDQVFGDGLARIEGAGSIEFGAEAENDVIFSGKAAGTLILDNTSPGGADDPFFGSIIGFTSTKTTSDTIDLRDLAFVSGSMSVNPSFGPLDASLIVSNGTATSAALSLVGTYTAGQFLFASDNHGGTDITLVKPT